MGLFEVRLFGRFEIECKTRPTGVPNVRRARELLCYLLLRRDQPVRRETLADVLWDAAAPEQARKYLRQALWHLQTSLHRPDDPPDTQALEVDAEWVQLNTSDRFSVDVAHFENVLRECHGTPGPRLDEARRLRLEEAVELYRGDLLEGWFQDWCLLERERLQNDYLDALEKLACACEHRHESERGLAYARRLLAVDPTREQVHSQVMRLHMIAGQRTQALGEFHRCERMLARAFGIKPSQQTVALFVSIRDGCGEDTGSPAGGEPDPSFGEIVDDTAFAPDALPALADMLARLQRLIAGIETRLRQGADTPGGALRCADDAGFESRQEETPAQTPARR